MRYSLYNHNVSPTAFTLRAILYFICQSYFKKYVTEKTPSISHATVRYLPLYHWHILRCHFLERKQIYKQILINKPTTAVLSGASYNFELSSVFFFFFWVRLLGCVSQGLRVGMVMGSWMQHSNGIVPAGRPLPELAWWDPVSALHLFALISRPEAQAWEGSVPSFYKPPPLSRWGMEKKVKPD